MNSISPLEKPDRSLVPHILYFMFCLEVLFVFIKKLSPGLYGIFDLFEKLYPVAAIFILVVFMRQRPNFFWSCAIVSYVLFLTYGVFISIANDKSTKTILVQFYHELKFFPILLLFSTARTCSTVWVSRTIKLIKKLMLISVLLIIFQYALSSAYDTVFSNGGHHEKGFFGPLVLTRAVGWFWHSSQLATFFLMAIVLMAVSMKDEHLAPKARYIVFSIIFMFLSLQRFEMALLFLTGALFAVRRYTGINYKPYVAIGIFLLITVSIISITKDRNYIPIFQYNFDNERNQMLAEAMYTVIESDYLGAGWGTVGSHAAADVVKVYDFNAMKDFWWVKEGRFFYDSYWPHIIGELGWPGSFLLALTMAFMIAGMRTPESALLLTLLLLTSAFSSSTQDIMMLTQFGWMIFLLENLVRLRGSKSSA